MSRGETIGIAVPAVREINAPSLITAERGRHLIGWSVRCAVNGVCPDHPIKASRLGR